jgi:hypothetical protein
MRKTKHKVNLGRHTIRFHKWTWYVRLMPARLPRLIISGPWIKS